MLIGLNLHKHTHVYIYVCVYIYTAIQTRGNFDILIRIPLIPVLFLQITTLL